MRTGGPKGYIFTIKVSEDIAVGSVGFSLVQRKWSCVSLTSAIDGKSSILGFCICTWELVSQGVLYYQLLIYSNIWAGKNGFKEALSINALRACVYIYIQQLSSFRAPTLWLLIWLLLLAIFNTLFWVYTIFFMRKQTKHKNTLKSDTIFIWYENDYRRLLGAQSINTEKASLS